MRDLEDVADAGQLARLRASGQLLPPPPSVIPCAQEAHCHQLAAELAAALDLVEEAVPQVHPRALPVLQERLARAASRARARMEQRR